MRICVKILNGSKWIVNVCNVIKLKKNANLNPNLILSGLLATVSSNILLPSETVFWAGCAVPEGKEKTHSQPGTLTPGTTDCVIFRCLRHCPDGCVKWDHTPTSPHPLAYSCLTQIIHVSQMHDRIAIHLNGGCLFYILWRVKSLRASHPTTPFPVSADFNVYGKIISQHIPLYL